MFSFAEFNTEYHRRKCYSSIHGPCQRPDCQSLLPSRLVRALQAATQGGIIRLVPLVSFLITCIQRKGVPSAVDIPTMEEPMIEKHIYSEQVAPNQRTSMRVCIGRFNAKCPEDTSQGPRLRGCVCKEAPATPIQESQVVSAEPAAGFRNRRGNREPG